MAPVMYEKAQKKNHHELENTENVTKMGNQYTESVNVIAKYIEATEPLFIIAKQQADFSNLESQLQYALRMLKEHPDYQDGKDSLN